MPEISFSTYAGRKDGGQSEMAAAFERSTRLEQAQPTTGEVIGAAVEETFQGAGSFSQDIAAMNIRTSQARDITLSEDDWKRSDNFRAGLAYHPTMTEYESKVLADRHDQRIDNELIQSKASGLQTAAGMGTSLLTGIVEPKNFVSGVAAALFTGGVGALVPSVGRVVAVNTVRSAAARGVAEGVVGAALTEPLSMASAKQLQDDYTFADSMMNLAIGSVLGAGLGAGGKALELRGKAKQAEIAEAYKAESKLAIKELDTALAQTVQGAPIDVASVKQIDNAEVAARARQELPKIEERIAATGVTKVTDTPEFKTWFGESKVVDDAGAPKVMYHGTAKDIEEFAAGRSARGLIFFTDNPKFASDYTTSKGGSEAGGANVIPVYISANKIHKPMRWSEAQGLGAEHFTDRGYDAVKIIDDGGVETLAVVKPTQIKSIFNRGKFDPNDPRLIDAERLQVRKGQAEANSKIQADNAPIKKLQDDLAKPDNSTAYSPKDSFDVQKYIDDAGGLEDDIRLEQEFEGMKEELASMHEQGLLSAEEIGILENMADAEAQAGIYDNILLNAKICLTRG